MEQRLHIGPSEPSVDREKEFNDDVEQIRNRLRSVNDRRQNSKEQDNIPFINALLQSGVPYEQVSKVFQLHKVIDFTCCCIIDGQ